MRYYCNVERLRTHHNHEIITPWLVPSEDFMIVWQPAILVVPSDYHLVTLLVDGAEIWMTWIVVCAVA
jgi:hypothetical protein